MADPRTFADDALQYAPQLFSAAMRLTHDRTDAEDLVQETFLRAYRAYPSFTTGTNLRAWLFRILTNTFITSYRSRQRRPQEVELDDAGDPHLYRSLARRSSSTNSAEDQVMALFPDAEVRGALEALPDAFRLPVLLADVEGFGYREIADILDIPIGTVMSRLHRGRKAMYQRLYEYAAHHGLVPAAPTSADPTTTAAENDHHG